MRVEPRSALTKQPLYRLPGVAGTDEGRVRGLFARYREVPTAPHGPHGGPGEVRIRVRPPHRGDRQRPVLPLPVQPLHRRRALPHDRPHIVGDGDFQLQHRPRGGPEPLFCVGGPRGVHVPSVQARVHEQPHDPQALRGGRVRGQGLTRLQQVRVLRDGDPQEDGRGRGLEGPGPRARRQGHRRHRRRRQGEGHLQGRRGCPAARSRHCPGC